MATVFARPFLQDHKTTSAAKAVLQPAGMAASDDERATVTLAVTELKSPMMDWSVGDTCKEFMGI